MSEKAPFSRVDLSQLERAQELKRPPLRIRWWVLPLALVACGAQAVLNQLFEFNGAYLIATQISVIAFGFLFLLAFVLNPLLRVTGVVEPLNRGELMALFAAMFVSAGISTFGLIDQLVPLIAGPHNAQWNTPQRGWDKDVIPFLRDSLFITDSKAIAEFREGFDSWDGLYWKIPWRLWLVPVGLWMVFIGAMYMMFYSLSLLLYDTWARREKLVFPLARLPEDLIHAEGDAPGSMPRSVRTGLFWIGFIAVLALFSYNGACQAGWFRGLKALKLGLDQNALRKMLLDTPLRGLTIGSRHRISFVITFTTLCIGFLLPLEISFSLWSYRLLNLFAFFVAISMGFGATVGSFPTDWLFENNFITAMGAGGLMAFSAACIVKLILERWADTARMPGDASLGGRIGMVVVSLGWGGLLFVTSLAVSMAWLCWAGVPLIWTVLFLAVVILVTLGLMRCVAEGGVYWMQFHTSPFHIMRMLGVAKAVAVAPLMAAYSILFLDIKTFMAPCVLDSFKMQDEARAARKRFHLIVIASIVVTIGVAFLTILALGYVRGADRAPRWFFTGLPTYVFDQAQRLASGSIVARPDSDWIFYVVGAAWVVVSLLMRRRFFWWLHPIGFVMMANPLMTSLWFSFFLGWLCKKLAVKYGGRHMFAKLRPLFIGLLMGELAACFLWSVLAQIYSLDNVRIDINRYLP